MKCQKIDANSKPRKLFFEYFLFELLIITNESTIIPANTWTRCTKAIKKINDVVIVLVGPVK